jgi:ketosteroid isomerase-like protein
MKTFAPLFLLTAGLALAQYGNPAKAEKAVMDHMNRYAQAMVKADKAELEKLFADNLMYSHSGAQLENKQQAIEVVVSGKNKYESITFSDPKVMVSGRTAIVRCDVAVKNVSNGTPQSLKLNALHVWMRNAGGWQLVARQSTRYPQ